MDGKRIIISGGRGLLGRGLLQDLVKKNSVLAISNGDGTFDCSVNLDIRERAKIIKLVGNFSPNLIIHTAALTNLDYCEKNKKDAWEVNVEGTRNIALACREIGAKMIYVSTDYVFDGNNGRYKETDTPNPISTYAQTKYEGERIVSELSNHLICRTSVLYGNHPRPNFVVWVVNELRKGNKINVVKDQFNSPTLADDLSDMIIKLVEAEQTGIFHTAGRERINRLDFVKKITEVYDLDYSLVNPIDTKDLNWVAHRPMDSSLDVSKVSKFKKPLNIVEGLTKMRDSQ
jgi:dTDP-4-dehydrorhamnose reductase